MSDSIQHILNKLNPQQRQAVEQIHGPVLVLAGAGTGKTRVITTRIAYMISQGVPPSEIAAMTFTNKAANEMRERVALLVPLEAAEKVTLGTFHSFCARILRRDIHLAGNYDRNFSILDEADQTGIIKQSCAELGYSKEDFSAQSILSFISHYKNKMLYPEDLTIEDTRQYGKRAKPLTEIYNRYQRSLELQNAVDFDDLLLLTLKIFKTNGDCLRKYKERWHFILVDEYQDINAAQMELIRYLTQERQNICVVGDDDQSIYAWRGADVENILNFPTYYPGTLQIKLEQNYRSTNTILNAANAIIAHNGKRYDKKLWSARQDGEPVHFQALPEGEAEAEYVLHVIENIRMRYPSYNYSDFAILYRSNYLSRIFEQVFRNHGIRPVIFGGQEFYQRKEVKDALAYLKLIVNPRDDQSLLRILSVPPRGLGDKTILSMRNYSKSTGRAMQSIMEEPEFCSTLTKVAANSCANLVKKIQKARAEMSTPGDLAQKITKYLTDVGYLNGFQRIYKDSDEANTRQENVNEFISSIGLYERNRSFNSPSPTLLEWIEKFSLLEENDKEEDLNRNAPIFSTVHAAKGLEFPIVFVVGLEEGIFPHERSLNESASGEEEERRLFYVAITRAKEKLFLTMSKTRFVYKEFEVHAPSSFLNDLPSDLLDKEGENKLEFTQPSFVSNEEQKRSFENILKNLALAQMRKKRF